MIFSEKSLKIIFILIIFFYICMGLITDITTDEVCYVFMYRDSGMTVFQYLYDYLIHADHFPLVFSVKLFFLQIFGNIIFLRLFSIFCGLIILRTLYNILIFHGISGRNSMINIVFTALSPIFLYNALYFTYYHFALMFMCLGYYAYLSGKKKTGLFYMISACASHYFSIFFLALYILKLVNIRKNLRSFILISAFMLFSSILIFLKFENNLGNLKNGESEFISVQDTLNPELTPDFMFIFKSIGNSIIFPGMYRPYTLTYGKNIVVSIAAFFCIFFTVYRNRRNILIFSVPAFFILLVLVSQFVRYRYGIYIYAPARIFFVSFFAVICMNYCILLIPFKRYFFYMIIFILYVNSYLYIYNTGKDIQKISEYIKDNQLNIISRAKDFHGKFDYYSMIEYYIGNIKPGKSENIFYLVLKHSSHEIERKHKAFERKLLYDSDLLQIYCLFPKKSFLK